MAKATAKPGTNSDYTSKQFYLDDLMRTLFPLTTNRVLVEAGAADLLAYSNSLIANNKPFLPQRRVYASKDKLHLRRTVKLDPVAEYFLYDLVFRNRTLFRKSHSADREHYGYRFENSRPQAPSKSYRLWKSNNAVREFAAEESLSFDIASYFNNVYQHDLHSWFGALGAQDDDVAAFGKFFREINAGRSLDCLPQGLYPTKMIGNDFLRFIEESANVRSAFISRFMDDVYLYDNNLNVLKKDFAEIQRVVGLKGLSVNASKTRCSDELPAAETDEEPVDEIKKRLLKRRRDLIVQRYDDGDLDEGGEATHEMLDDEEIGFIEGLLKGSNLREEDAELIMVLMRDHVELLEDHLALFAEGYPHLAKNFYGLCSAASDKDAVASIVSTVTASGNHVPEYQLFWFGRMLEDYLMTTKHAADLIHALYNHASATDITKAKILEIADQRFGLPEMREGFLREGRSDWLSWSSAVGARGAKRQTRNYLLDYFANGSEMNRLFASIVKKLP